MTLGNVAGTLLEALVATLPEVDQMEINPLLVSSQGRGCAAVDVRVLVKPIK